MKIGEKTFVSLSYTLKVGKETVDSATKESPLEFVFGAGYLLPKFEENIAGLRKGDKFEFTLTPAEGYGETIEDAVVELPKDIFMVDGTIEDGLLEIGNQIPMSTADGQHLIGTVKEVGAENVTMDFNHPMAGKTLDFSGEIVDVREATDADIMGGMMAAAGCGCGCGESDCDCGEESGSCGCN
jgi:FKBP-type peptidyl-prolyl cis-trans isomerase SlyD